MSQLQVEDDQGMNVCTEGSLTLRRLLVWMYDPKVRLKTLAALVDFCQGGFLEVMCVLVFGEVGRHAAFYVVVVRSFHSCLFAFRS